MVMGVTSANFKVKPSKTSAKEREVEFIIDSGAIYSL
jgi:hypothetical protein